MTSRRPAVAALGGGHGLAVSLQALQLVTDKITAIVTVADDGGSSGRLRNEFGILPPGDLRMALAALCDTSEWGLQWRDALQHRYPGDGPLGGHAFGNLLIASLWDLLGDPVEGLDLVGRLLGARGRVLPMAAEPLRIEASVLGADPDRPDEVTDVIGQVEVATTRGRVQSVRLHPDPPKSCQPAIDAVLSADWVILGPGSWFSSVMPHLLVPDLCQALVRTPARKLLTLNMIQHDDETKGFSAADYLEVLAAHAPDLQLDVVLADTSVHGEEAQQLSEVASRLGAIVVREPIADTDRPAAHDPLRLAAAYRDVLDTAAF